MPSLQELKSQKEQTSPKNNNFNFDNEMLSIRDQYFSNKTNRKLVITSKNKIANSPSNNSLPVFKRKMSNPTVENTERYKFDEIDKNPYQANTLEDRK